MGYPGCTDYTCDAHSAKPAESLKCCGQGIDFQGYLDHANPGCYAKYTDINDCWSWTSSDEPGLLQQASSSATGRCCFNGCDPNSCSDSDWCSTEENCLKPQSQGGCNSNTTGGATPTWCPAQAELQARAQQGQSLTAVACPASFVLEDVCSWEYPGCTDYTCDAHSAKPAESLKCCGQGIDFQGYLDHANPGCYAKYTDINDCWSWTS